LAPLAIAGLERAAKRHGRHLQGFAPCALQALQNYSWPGNVRELCSVVERAVLLARGERVEAGDLRLELGQVSSPSLEDLSLEDAERALIRAALKRYSGNASAAADALGLSRSAIYRRMEKLGLRTDV